jgi:hypothetical protein
LFDGDVRRFLSGGLPAAARLLLSHSCRTPRFRPLE